MCNLVMEKDSKYVMQTYGRQPLILSKGSGALVQDIYGQEYIDCVAGIAVNNVGHCHPRVVRAIQAQAEKLVGMFTTRRRSALRVAGQNARSFRSDRRSPIPRQMPAVSRRSQRRCCVRWRR